MFSLKSGPLSKKKFEKHWIKVFWEGKDDVQDNFYTGRTHVENINLTQPIWVHAITITSPKWKKKNHCKGPGITQEMNLCVL